MLSESSSTEGADIKQRIKFHVTAVSVAYCHWKILLSQHCLWFII